MALHKSLTVGDIHIPYQWSYADATARLAATGFVTGDVGKLARQLDNNTLWALTNHSPIAWKNMGDGGVPTSHASTHQNGGGDEVATATAAANAIPKAGSGGKLDVGWVPTGSDGSSVCIGNDSRLSDARTPTSHATSHKNGGSDEVATATAGANLIPKAGATGKLDINWVPTGATGTTVCVGNDSRLSDSRTPTSHASSHNSGGGDALAIDAVAGTGSLRTLGTAATSACAGNDSRLSDNRTDSNAIHKTTSAEISAFTEKTTPVSADVLVIEDSAASYAKKKVQIANLPTGADSTALHKATAAEISAMTEKTSPVDADLIVIEDSAASNAKKKVQLGNITKSLVKTTLVSLAADASTTSGTWVDLLSSSVTTTIGTKFSIFAHVACDNSNGKGSAIQYFRLNVDGTGQNGVAATVQVSAEPVTVALVGQAAVTAGSHTVKLQWYTAKGTVRCRPVTLPDENSAAMIIEEVRV